MDGLRQTWLDRAVGFVAPAAQLRRVRARIAADLLIRHYDAAAGGRRTSGWSRRGGDANVALDGKIDRIRDLARDAIRNDGQAKSAIRTIKNHVVGWGIVAKADPVRARVQAAWDAWANSTRCDADGRRNFYGIQKLVMGGTAEAGEMLVRRRWRRLGDGLPLPIQLQVLEPDYLDANKTTDLPTGGWITHGIEFDALGTRVAYWLFPKHPGSTFSGGARSLFAPSRRIPAADIIHTFEGERAGQVRAISWFAPVFLPMKDLSDYGDAQVMKQKIAACLAVITSDMDGTAAPIGTADDTESPGIDALEPGGILNIPPGRQVTVVQPPSVGDYEPFTRVEQRKIAKGLGLSYEDYTGDYSAVNFSSARMSRLEHWDNVYDWRWNLLIPQLCDPVWGWAMEAMEIAGILAGPRPGAFWTAPPMPMIEPDKEGLAFQRNIRNGLTSLFEALRERGYDPRHILREIADGNAILDDLGIVLDSDPRRTTQAGQVQAPTQKRPTEDAPPTGDTEEAA